MPFAHYYLGLILIYLYLEKISGQHHYRISSLSKQHAIHSLLNKHYSKKAEPHHMTTSQLMAKQQSKINSLIVDTNNHLNKVFSSFNSLNKELSSGFPLVDSFSNCFSFLKVNQKDPKSLTAY